MVTKSESRDPDAAQGALRVRLRAYILDRMRSGALKPGDRIPSEHELMALFDASRMTVHHAIRAMAADGLLRRTKGAGTFVEQPKAHLTTVRVVDIAEQARKAGLAYRIDTLAAESVVASAEQAATFGIEAGRQLYHSILLHWGGDTPLQLEDRLVNPAAVPDYLDVPFNDRPPHGHLMNLYPYPDGEHRIRAIEAGALEKAHLRLQPGEPCLEVRRITRVMGLTVTSVRLIHPGFRFELEGIIQAPL